MAERKRQKTKKQNGRNEGKCRRMNPAVSIVHQLVAWLEI